MRREREEVRVSKDRKLGFQSEQLPFGGTIELSLLGSCVASISLGDVTGDRKGGGDERISGCLGFASRALAHNAKNFAAESDCLLPDFEIPEASGHGHTMAALPAGTDIKRFPLGADGREQRRRPSAACGNPCL